MQGVKNFPLQGSTVYHKNVFLMFSLSKKCHNYKLQHSIMLKFHNLFMEIKFAYFGTDGRCQLEDI